MTSQNDAPVLLWDAATGYDFFVSLHVLHEPDQFALRGSWAKGVRTRLPQEARTFFEEVSRHLLSALPWVCGLNRPRDAETVLAALAALPEEKRFATLLTTPEVPDGVVQVLERIVRQEGWSAEDREELAAAGGKFKNSASELNKMLDLYARAASLGRVTLASLSAYYDVFFSEEELRIQPALEAAVIRGQEMAEALSLPDLLAELSEGIRFEEERLAYEELVMIPSFWMTPRIVMSRLSPTRGLFIHGGRSPDASLVPGEAVPDALYLTLKALADPTRLRILHYLEQQPQTPSELAKTLRLRAPTVIHHLNSLRLAGLVYVTYGKGDKRYACRSNRISEMYLQLRRYLGVSEMKRREDIAGRPPYIA